MIDLGTTFLSSVDRCPEAIAITYQNKHLNDKLITLLPNTFEACTIHWACQLTGIVIVPINWRVKSEEIIFFLKNSKSTETVTNVFFQNRRKMIKKPLNILFKDSSRIKEKLKLNDKVRPQNINPLTFFKIAKEYEEKIYLD